METLCSWGFLAGDRWPFLAGLAGHGWLPTATTIIATLLATAAAAGGEKKKKNPFQAGALAGVSGILSGG